MSYTPFDTADTIINDAAVQVGLTSVTDPFASTDQNFVQFCRLLKSVGRRLYRLHPWSHLQKSATLTTVLGQQAYDPADDYGYMISGASWNTSSRMPMGSMSPQEWAANTGFNILGTQWFRMKGSQFYLSSGTSTPDGQNITYEYVSRFWVRPQGQTTGTTEVPSASSDTILFNPQLAVTALKRAFLAAKGFDTTAADRDYETALEQAKSDDSNGAPSLPVTGGVGSVLIDYDNAPPTGYGA